MNSAVRRLLALAAAGVLSAVLPALPLRGPPDGPPRRRGTRGALNTAPRSAGHRNRAPGTPRGLTAFYRTLIGAYLWITGGRLASPVHIQPYPRGAGGLFSIRRSDRMVGTSSCLIGVSKPPSGLRGSGFHTHR